MLLEMSDSRIASAKVLLLFELCKFFYHFF
jgi:hypothetical protein